MSSACDHCYRPGSCCSGFILSLEGLSDNPTSFPEVVMSVVENEVERRVGYPIPFSISERIPNVGWVFHCNKLVDGRCSIYEDRPQLCHDFAPCSDRLCIHFDAMESGDPTIGFTEVQAPKRRWSENRIHCNAEATS